MEFVRTIPVECLTAGEAAGVWSGWYTFGDREVVREASAKGTHINLAHKCLAYRRRCTIGDAQKYFNEEVEIWVNELLGKQQIHRASHILKNSGKDPLEFIKKKCIECKETKLRNYLANFVMAKDGFEDAHKESWNLINITAKYEERNGLQHSFVENKSIAEITQLPDEVKSALITELFFNTNEEYLAEKLNNTVLWDYLLSNNEIDSIYTWIDTKYRNGEEDEQKSEETRLSKAFRELEIVEDMVEAVDTSNAMEPIKELVLNRFCKYGIFAKKERNDIQLTLARFFSNCTTPAEFPKILSYKQCNIDRETFEEKIFSIIYYRSASEEFRDRVPQDRKLLETLTATFNSTEPNESLVQLSIVETAKALSKDTDQYFADNPLMVFALAHLEYLKNSQNQSDDESTTKAIELKDIFYNDNGLNTGTIVIPPRILRETLDKLPYLKRAMNEENFDNDITMYQLLDGYRNLDVQRLFKWRFRNEPMPSFTNEKLIKKYGRKERLNYLYYLKQARPSTAAYFFQQEQNKFRDGMNSKKKYEAASHAHLFGLQNAENTEILCGCVSFIELIGVDSQFLRLHATAVVYVKKALNVSIYKELERIAVSNNEKDLTTVLKLLDDSFQLTFSIDIVNDTKKFVQSLKDWDFIVRFARAHNALPPTTLMNFLATNNLWFEFVLVAQVFAYNLEQVMESVKDFENCSIRQHLSLALSNSHILSTDFNEGELSKNKSRELIASTTRQCSVEESQIEDENDFWMVILKCHQSQDPPGTLLAASRSTRTPSLTVLATCYEPSATPAYCYSWLVISAEIDELELDYATCLTDQLWPVRRVTNLFRSIISYEYVETLSRGFQIFMPDNPLNAFFAFLVQCIKHGDYAESPDKLREFITVCSTLKSNKIIDWESTETDYLHNSYWIVTTAIECTMAALGNCFHSAHLQKFFLDIMVKCKINEDLRVETPNFHNLGEIITILSKTETRFDFSAIRVTEQGSNVETEIKRCISDLMNIEDFSNALRLSKVSGLHCSTIIIAQYRCEFMRSNDDDRNVDSSFWLRCADDFKKYEVSFEEAATFFVEHAEKVVSHKERYQILKLALEILEPMVTDKQTIDTVEMAMWKSCILAGPDSIEIESNSSVFNKLKTELLSGVSNFLVSCTLNDTEEESSVEGLINRFIAAGDLSTAIRISTIFNYKHRDLRILMLCLSLAEGEISPYQLTAQQKSLLSENDKGQQKTLRNRGFHKRTSSSSLSLSSPSPINSSKIAEISSTVMIKEIQRETLSLIERLVKNLQNGSIIGTRITLCVKLAMYLRRSYQSLLTIKDPMLLLYEVVGSQCDRKLEMVGDIIAAYRITDEMVAKFLAEEIVANILRLVEEGLEDSIVMWGYQLGGSIQAIIDLCNDPSLLGWELLKMANLSLGNSHGERRNVLTLKVVVELLIRSHDCFTASCSMEGISSILRKSKPLAHTLQSLKHWSILVRLVTGIGRFSEMNYVFQMLKENDQFEFLLGKGLDKIPGLKTALLEFSKIHCPDNKELFMLIALHFRLYNEIALMWENAAKEIINELMTDARKSVPKISNAQQTGLKLTKNENVDKMLQVALANFTHATEYYLQDDKLNAANRCSYQAQLTALQICLVNGISQNQQATFLFNLSPEEINKIMCQALTLSQTLILVEAYNHHGDWSTAVYHHVVINGEMRYLKEFVACDFLTSTIVQDCASRYRSEKTITKQMTENMQSLVSELCDVECKYVLASQLGFKKIIEDMLASSTIAAYLKDTVWKQGSSSSKEFTVETYRA